MNEQTSKCSQKHGSIEPNLVYLHVFFCSNQFQVALCEYNRQHYLFLMKTQKTAGMM